MLITQQKERQRDFAARHEKSWGRAEIIPSIDGTRCARKICMMKRLPVIATLVMFLFPNGSLADVQIFEQFASTPVLTSGRLCLRDLVAEDIISRASQGWWLLMPAAGRISSTFGWRRDPFQRGRRFHAGVDISNLRSSRVSAAAPGRVIFAGWGEGCGWMAVIDHGGRIETRYCHLAAVEVRRGEAIGAGEAVGEMGASGRATGAHLHFELRHGDLPIDPAPMLVF